MWNRKKELLSLSLEGKESLRNKYILLKNKDIVQTRGNFQARYSIWRFLDLKANRLDGIVKNVV